jgi:hypothetical protein
MASIYPVNRAVDVLDTIPEHHCIPTHSFCPSLLVDRTQKIKGSDNVVSHDEGPELLKQFSLQGFTPLVAP